MKGDYFFKLNLKLIIKRSQKSNKKKKELKYKKIVFIYLGLIHYDRFQIYLS